MLTHLFKSILFFVLLIPVVTFAHSKSILSGQYALGLDLGVVAPDNLGQSTTFPLGFSTFSYSPSNNDINAIISGVAISRIFSIAPLYTLEPGVSAHYLSNMTMTGNLAQGISPPYYQANYSYNTDSFQFLVDAKLRRQFYERLFPYIYLGFGVASNRTYSYSTTVPGYLTVTPQYSNNTINSFTYSLGLGADYFIKHNLTIGFGYRFIDLGKTGPGSGVINTTSVPAKLVQSNLYVNTVLAQLNYFFDV